MYEIPGPEELRVFMQKNNLTSADIAAFTGVKPRTVRRWIMPANQKDAKPIPWSDWALILILTDLKTKETILDWIDNWQSQASGIAREIYNDRSKTFINQ